MVIQWYPGHMAKAKKMITENLKLVDVVVEILDARIPFSSRNPDFKEMFNNKKDLLILNKYDLADPAVSSLWKKFYNSKDVSCVFVNSKDGLGMQDFNKEILLLMKDKFERDKSKGMLRRPVKAMIVGIPNSGKSTFINKLSNSSAAKTGDKPGVTKDKQWIRLNNDTYLLDTPGVLWPKFGDDAISHNLALTGAINDDILDKEELCISLLDYMKIHYPTRLTDRYGEIDATRSARDILLNICKLRGFIKTGNEFDTLRASIVVLDEFRGGKMGRVSLEVPK
ncbi:MAG: ribosome biogenesis GTPase YlqF [Clostridia bacterium]|jgi:ribosome biogenesis GTPase A